MYIFEQIGDKKEVCSVCLDGIVAPKTLKKCGHTFCTDCIDRSFKTIGKNCPICKESYGVSVGNQPVGQMIWRLDQYSTVPGCSSRGVIIIDYQFHSGKQGKEHPHPGKYYSGTRRTAYLPGKRI